MARKRVKQPQEAGPEAGQEAVAVRSTGAAAQHTWRNIRLIVRREYVSRVTQRSFVVSTVMFLVVIAIAGFVPTIVRIISSRGQAQAELVVVNEAGTVA
jgi:ABC-2 type transport system permease protein